MPAHNVPLYRVVENGQEYFKYNDDGEPSNTAGKNQWQKY
jgi:putative IMPACT (imprinted ancient) family translation regulator